MRSNGFANCKVVGLMVALAMVLAVAGCAPEGATGALEEGELYNSQGLLEQPLFNERGLAPLSRFAAPYVRVGFLWDAEAGCRLEGRFLFPDGSWSDWYELRAHWSEGIAHAGHIDVPGNASPIGFQLRHRAGPAPSFLLAEGIERVGEIAEPELAPRKGLSSQGQALAPASLVHPRSDWGARSPACNSGSHSPAKVTVHHTATPLPDSLSPTARLRQIQAYHIDSRGWCDIGYHYLVDWNGELWQGRYETTIGAHVANHNTNNVGISFMGTYNSTSPTSSQLGNVAELLSWLHDRYGIPLNRSYVKGHREYRGNAAGDCPGDKVYAKLQYMIDLAAGGGGGGGGGGGDPDPGGDGRLLGVVFEDTGAGTADMSHRLPGATVSVSGGPTTTASSGDALWQFTLPPGTYNVTASATGYQSASRTCTVTTGADSWCSLGLFKQVQATGVIQGVVFVDTGAGTSDMSHRLPGATVSLSNGQSTSARAGDAFWSFEVASGDYTVTASASGYQSASRSCTVFADGDTWCSIGLVPDEGRNSGGSSGGDSGSDSGGNSGGSSGGDSGSDSGGNSGGDSGGADPGQDPGGDVAGKGLVFGRVVDAMTVLDPKNVAAATGLAGAEVLVDDQVITTTDSNGYYQAWVEPGEITVLAKADGYLESGNSCNVEADGRVECNIFMPPEQDQQPAEDDPMEQPPLQGCSTSGGAPGGLYLLLLGLLLSRRRRRR